MDPASAAGKKQEAVRQPLRWGPDSAGAAAEAAARAAAATGGAKVKPFGSWRVDGNSSFSSTSGSGYGEGFGALSPRGKTRPSPQLHEGDSDTDYDEKVLDETVFASMLNDMEASVGAARSSAKTSASTSASTSTSISAPSPSQSSALDGIQQDAARGNEK